MLSIQTCQTVSLATTGEPATKKQRATAQLHALQQLSVALHGPQSCERDALEQFIRERFYQVHHATIKYFMPDLMSIRDTQHQLLAACGLRWAANEPLFLETYLDAPVEDVLSNVVGKPIGRQTIVEVGNLAVQHPYYIRTLLAGLSRYLHTTHTDWVVFTGITSLYNAMKKLNMPLYVLGQAGLEMLPEEDRAGWGSYYDDHPQVLAIPRMRSGSC